MQKEEFIESVEINIQKILKSFNFTNYKKQLIAWKISPKSFNRTYSEGYLWNRALNLSTNACILILEGGDQRLIIHTLKECGEIYEYLSEISEEYDKEYCLILSALCYDLSGYQANAFCLMRSFESNVYQLTSETLDLTTDNYILNSIQLILSKKIGQLRASIDSNNESADLGKKLFNEFIFAWTEHILRGKDTDYVKAIDRVYKYYLYTANVYLSHLLFLLKSRILTYTQRSTWNLLKNNFNEDNKAIWSKYIRLLTNDIFHKNKIQALNKRVSKFEFWTSQIRALEAGLLSSHDNYVIQMPTSAGKTFIAEVFILNELIKNPQKKCIYIAPFRALSNEKEVELSNYLSKLGYSVSSLSGSYETDIFEDTILEDTDVLIATPEKIDLLLRLKPEYFQTVSALVVDEGHIIGDISQRASLLEFLIIRLRIKIENLRVLFISAVMPPANANQYSLWLSGDKDKVIRSLLLEGSLNEEEWEPTRKLLGKFEWKDRKGRITYLNTAIDSNTMDSFVPSIIMEKQFADKYPKVSDKAQTAACLAIQLLTKDDKSNCLIFCAQARRAISLAKKFVEIIEEIEVTDQKLAQQFKINENSESYYLSKEWFGNDSPITSCIKRGIGIHYGDLPEALRKSIESRSFAK